MKLSVIIPCLNEAAYIEPCIRSVQSDVVTGDEVEIIVVDAGSADGTVAIAHSCGVRVLDVQRSTIAAQRNAGATAAQGDVLAFLDSDCTVAEGWVRAGLSIFKDPEVVGGGSPPDVPIEGTTWVQRGWSFLKRKRRPHRMLVHWIPSANVWVRRSAFDQIGGFNDRLETCEDADLGFRISEKGLIISDPNIRVYHHREPHNLHHFFKKEVWHGKNSYSGLMKGRMTVAEIPSLVAPFYFGFSILTMCLTLSLVAAGSIPVVYAIASTILLLSLPLAYTVRAIVSKGNAHHLLRYLLIYFVYFLARFVALVASLTRAATRTLTLVLFVLLYIGTCLTMCLIASPDAQSEEFYRLQPYDWVEGDDSRKEGATKDYYNLSAGLSWKNSLGDWTDANGTAQGTLPISSAKVIDSDTSRFIDWDVTELVREWSIGKSVNQGFLLTTEDNGKIDFISRESGNPIEQPQLVVEAGDARTTYSAVADTELTSVSAYPKGKSIRLRVASAGKQNVLIKFNPPRQTGLTSATLRLWTSHQFGDATIDLYRCSPGNLNANDARELGYAYRYQDDSGIADDGRTIFATGFERYFWNREWTQHSAEVGSSQRVGSAPRYAFKPLQGNALQIHIRKGKLLALNKRFYFEREGTPEPTEVFFRYYLRLGSDWNQTLQSGKLPGIAGTYGKAGWGGRPSDGTNGWSARGLFMKTIPPGNPLAGKTPIGTYCYHADMTGSYGDAWIWDRNYRGFIDKNRWYCVEHHVRLNTPGKNDGVLEGWIDGYLAFRKSDIRYRDLNKIKIENIWMNVYHGGIKPSPYDQHLFIDNVVVATEYIGPMRRTKR